MSAFDVREVWPHEAQDFTPWLAQNLDWLSVKLGIGDLELEDTEVQIGPYHADIVARTTENGARVLIENQLEGANLQHLGQVLAYLAGLDAQIIVWVAASFNDTHLAAIRWLNENTPESFSFFAVQVSVVQRLRSVLDVLEHPKQHAGELRKREQEAEDRELLENLDPDNPVHVRLLGFLEHEHSPEIAGEVQHTRDIVDWELRMEISWPDLSERYSWRLDFFTERDLASSPAVKERFLQDRPPDPSRDVPRNASGTYRNRIQSAIDYWTAARDAWTAHNRLIKAIQCESIVRNLRAIIYDKIAGPEPLTFPLVESIPDPTAADLLNVTSSIPRVVDYWTEAQNAWAWHGQQEKAQQCERIIQTLQNMVGATPNDIFRNKDDVVRALRVLLAGHEWNRQALNPRLQGELRELLGFQDDFWSHLASRHPDVPASPPWKAANSIWQFVKEADLYVVQYLANDQVGVFLRGNVGERWLDSSRRIEPYLDRLALALNDTNIQRDHTWLRLDPRDPEQLGSNGGLAQRAATDV